MQSHHVMLVIADCISNLGSKRTDTFAHVVPPPHLRCEVTARHLFLPPKRGAYNRIHHAQSRLVATQLAVPSNVSLGDKRQQCSTTSLNGVDPFVPYYTRLWSEPCRSAMLPRGDQAPRTPAQPWPLRAYGVGKGIPCTEPVHVRVGSIVEL